VGKGPYKEELHF